MNQAYYALVTLQAFFSDRFDGRKDRGATAVEYGLMVGLIAVVIIVAVSTLGGQLNGFFETITEKLGGGTGETIVE
ncbi:Flp family type IVb pilin [Dietzia maris]|uniref:Flp family type IVb pilin n=1 Tax=Dietzia maris TaxID=37915 RepID=UPI0022B3B0FF|nr:Flp family type IVb pilin [Dietzia maris]MCZ4540423.1 Flp family type IVb pilin [Dietzia maris]